MPGKYLPFPAPRRVSGSVTGPLLLSENCKEWTACALNNPSLVGSEAGGRKGQLCENGSGKYGSVNLHTSVQRFI